MGGEVRLLKSEWIELKPFAPGDENAGEINFQKMLDHIDRFTLAILRDCEGTVRTYIRIAPHHVVTLDGLDGIEAVKSERPDLAEFAHFKKYVTRRHCALSTIPAEMQRTSIYRILGHEVAESTCLLFSARKSDSPSPITQYIRYIDRGINPDSISRFWSSGAKKTPQRLRSKLQEANKKLQTRNLFLCKMYVCSHSRTDARSVEGVFPSRAFSSKSTSLKRVTHNLDSPISIPLFGSSHMLILSDEELLGFLAMPDTEDMANVNFDFGQIRSKSAGPPQADIP